MAPETKKIMQQPVRQYTRELHIDAHRIGDGQIKRLLALGFSGDNFTAAGGGLERPAHHFSWETQGTNEETGRRRHDVFETTVKILTGTNGFSGYIESEIIPPEFQVAIPRQRFNSYAQIPLEHLDLIKTTKNKVADLHIKVPLDLVSERLESEFTRVGCYFVETPKHNRIYTIQFLSHGEGKAVFTLLKNFFEVNGGVVELTYEICDAFVRVPQCLDAPTVLREGSLFQLSTP
jgi:hypothetical protein